MGLDLGWSARPQLEDNLRHLRRILGNVPQTELRYAAWVELAAIWAVSFRVAAAKGANTDVLDRIFAGFESALARELAADLSDYPNLGNSYDADLGRLVEAMWQTMGLPSDRVGWEIAKVLVQWYSGVTTDPSSISSNFAVVSAIGLRAFGTINASTKFLQSLT